MSWQLTSDVRLTKVTVFATTEEISAQLPITETDGGSSGMTTIFEGIPAADHEGKFDGRPGYVARLGATEPRLPIKT